MTAQDNSSKPEVVPSPKLIPCKKTFAIRISFLIAAMVFIAPTLAQIRDESLSQGNSEIKVQVGKVIAGYVGNKGSVEKAARDLIN